MADKYAVREWVKNKIGIDYLIPLLGVWDNFEDIDFAILPDKFAKAWTVYLYMNSYKKEHCKGP